ncbi:unnamed protein product [Parnassius apollo]|uniref:(apollo) hypothetical protein n=1 Tax=Parnassius apollo TaxID=110799 RepID=A0A8S3WBS0_PARAO|nr:unnamed protein product [Parnassius apollo]
MVEFMEKYGDISRPSGGHRGRHYIQMKWKELTEILNCCDAEDSKSEEKWRKVWSDFKNNTKRKFAKINRTADTGKLSLQSSLTDLENRVMQIMNVPTDMEATEADFPQKEDRTSPGHLPQEKEVEKVEEKSRNQQTSPKTCVRDRNIPERSSPTSSGSSNEGDDGHMLRKRKRKNVDTINLLKECERNAREYARERDRAQERLEIERLRNTREELRLRELELNERIRQRDAELNLQSQWLEFMKEAMKVFVRYVDKTDINHSK